MSSNTSFQPLYKQVYDLLTKRLLDGYWKPAEPLPSEMALAEELGVSQGTVRKALNQMEAEKLLIRRQGKGTFVSGHNNESSLFRFFRLRESNGCSMVPETVVVSSSRRPPTRDERDRFNLKGRKKVVELMRLRSLQGKPASVEKIIQPLSVFPDIDKDFDLSAALYRVYQEKYGVNIVSVHDELKATSLPDEYANHLKLEPGSPVLLVDRKSISMDGSIVELSQAYCRTDHLVYSVQLN